MAYVNMLSCVFVITALGVGIATSTCTDGQCGQGGHCSPTGDGTGSACVCNHGYTGIHCETPVRIDPCGSGGHCINTGTGSGYRCSCYVGYVLPHCDDRNECQIDSDVCNGGTCVNTPGSFKCGCPAGYTGTHCTVMAGSCNPNPCANGGQCSQSGTNSFTCDCPSGYLPPRCLDRNECELLSSLCNNGTCVNTQGSYKCNCNAGYVGTHCSEAAHPCSPNPCGTGGECNQTDSSYSCSCYVGFDPPNCSDRNECSIDPTLCTNGTCINTLGSFKCACNTGFTGHDCRDVIDPCAGMNRCHNHGTCVVMNGNPVCMCDTGYTGVLCEIVMTTTTARLPSSTKLRVVTATSSPSTTRAHPPATVLSQTSTDKPKGWISANWYVFVIAGVVVGVGVTGGVIYVYKRRTLLRYKRFDKKKGSTSVTEPEPEPESVTVDNPTYLPLEGVNKDTSDL